MEKEFSRFRKATFGGFNRKDVINYIEKMRNESFEYKSQVEQTVRSLNEKITELENAARLMEPSVFDFEAPCERENLVSMSDIGDETRHLKDVADELCRSLGVFIEKLSQKGVLEVEEKDTTDAWSSSDEQEVDSSFPSEEIGIVDEVMSSLSFLYSQHDNAKTGNAEEKVSTQEKDTVSDILSGLSFLS